MQSFNSWSKVSVEFYLYIPQLRGYAGTVQLVLHNEKHLLQQNLDLQEDIFSIRIDLYPGQIEYCYIIGNEGKEEKCESISRCLESQSNDKDNKQSAIIFVFDTPQKFEDKIMKFTTLKQTDIQNGLLIFAQENSSTEMLGWLMKFIQTNELKNEQELNLLQKLAKKVFSHVQVMLEGDRFEDILNIFDIFKNEWYKLELAESSQILQIIYSKATEDIQARVCQEINEIKKRFNFVQLLRELSNSNSIFSSEDLVIEANQRIQFAESNQELIKIQEEVYYEQMQLNNNNEKGLLMFQEVLKLFWKKCWEITSQNYPYKALQLLIKFKDQMKEIIQENHDSLKTLFLSCKNINSHKFQDFFMFLLKNITDFLNFFDPSGDALVILFQKPMTKEQTKQLFLAVVQGNTIILKCNIEEVCEYLADSFQNLNQVMKFYSFVKNQYYQLDLSKTMILSFNALVDQLPSEELFTALGFISEFKKAMNQFEINNNISLTSNIESKMREIISKKINNISFSRLLDGMRIIQNQKECEMYLQILKDKIETAIKLDDKNENNLFDLLQAISQKENQDEAQNSQFQVQVLEVIKNELKKIRSQKYAELRQTNDHLLSQYSLKILLSLEKLSELRAQIFADLVIYIEKIDQFDILKIQKKIFPSKVLEQFFLQFQDELQMSFASFVKKNSEIIQTYTLGRQKLSFFFGIFGEYLVEEKGLFEATCHENVPISEALMILKKFNKLKMIVLFYNKLRESKIFLNMLVFFEQQNTQQEKSLNNLQKILKQTKDSLIQFIFLISNIELNLSSFKKEYLSILKEYSIQYAQEQQSQEFMNEQVGFPTNQNMFKDGVLTLQNLRSLAGQTYNEASENIKLLLIIVQVAQVDTISSTLESVAKVQFLQQQSQTLINLSQHFSLPESQENSDFIEFLRSFQNLQNKLEEQPIKIFISYDRNCDINLGKNFVGKYPSDNEIQKIEQLHEILEFSQKNLKNGSFLELRELIEDDENEVMSLLIKLDSLRQLLTAIQQIKQIYGNLKNTAPEQLVFSKLIQDLIEITRTYLNSVEIMSNIDDCCKNFFKISQLAKSYEEKQSYIAQTKDIVQEGIYSFSLNANDKRSIDISIECQKIVYTEKQIRSVCSRVILKQKRNAINTSSFEQKNRDTKRSCSLVSEGQNDRDFDEQEIEKQEAPQYLDDHIDKFKEQWFQAEQLKDIFVQLTSFGNCELLTQRRIYSNQKSSFELTFQQMKEDNKQLLKELESRKKNIQQIIQQYPSFSLIGFRHYNQLNQYLAGNNETLTQDLSQILNVLGYQDLQIPKLFNRLPKSDLSSADSLRNIASIISTNFKHPEKTKGQQLLESIRSRDSILKLSFPGIQSIIKFLVFKACSLSRIPKYYQYFFYSSESEISDIELFFYRFQFLTIPNEQLDFFLIFSTQIEQEFFCTSQELLVNLNNPQKNKLYVLLLSENQHQNFSSIPEQATDFLDRFQNINTSEFFNKCNSKAAFYYSEFPGEGKTLAIQIAGLPNGSQVRIPTSNSENKADFLETFQSNAKQLKNVQSMHIDLYESEAQNINILLFELIFLRAVCVHSERLQNIDPQVFIYIEIANTFQQNLLQSIFLFEIVNKKKVNFNIQSFNFNHAFQSQKQKLNLVICNKYLWLLDKSGFSTDMNLESICSFPIDKADSFISQKDTLSNEKQTTFKILLDKFVVQIIKERGSKPCFNQLHRFIDLFGFEMMKFEKCLFLQVKNLPPNHLSQGIRTKIVAMSYRLSIQISMSRTSISSMQHNKSDRKEVEMDRISKSIEPFSKCVVNFVTFQEQEHSSITTFFDKESSVPTALLRLFGDYKKKMLFFEERNKPEDLLHWLILLINQNEQFMYKSNDSTAFSNLQNKQLKSLVKRIIILKDNFFKIATLFMRIRSNTPLIIMGEAGIGKSILVELMSNIMQAIFQTMIVHTGISDQQVVDFVRAGIKLQEEKNQRVILFFDEVNTNKMIGGLFKEILIDRSMKGIKLPESIIPIAAINPYKLKSETQKKMLNCQIHGGIKKEMVSKITNTDLEYMVEPLPDSMYSLIWNYDSLSLEDEQKYINKMVKIKAQMQLKKGQNSFDATTQKLIAETVFLCQNHIRKEMGYSSSCSLRDVTRFLNILYWLQNFLRICQDNNGLMDLNSQIACPCLAFYIIYCVRLPHNEQRQQLLELCAAKMKKTRFDYDRIIESTQQFLIDQCDVPSGIVKNSALKQNVFTLFISIINKLPVVLIGPPGSSKTLSIKILHQTMQGKGSPTPFFKNFPALMPFVYQGHMQSTSERIQEVFQKAIDNQDDLEKKKNTDNYLSLVYIEEIGLADISPYNPLKVFHSALENPKVAVACISNWPLDQSKMNRMISVFRLNTTEEELKETILHIWNEFLKNYEGSIEKALRSSLPQELPAQIAQVYAVYIANLKIDQPKFEQFHGMRDFYGMVKLFCFQEAQFIEQNLKGENEFKVNQRDRVCYAFQRHFSGLPQSLNILKNALSQHICEDKTIPLFEDSLNFINTQLQEEQSTHYMPRHLMVITDNLPSSVQYLSSRLLQNKKSVKTLVGSEFSDDMDSERAFKKINEIITCVEQGVVLIISNLDSIYQSIYELLNQSYKNVGDKNYCRITFGSEGTNIQVSPQFKLILVVDVNEVYRLDGPLINRFEKHFLGSSIFLTEADKIQVQEIKKYFQESRLTDLFRFNNLPEMIKTLVMQKRILEQTFQNDELIQQLYHLVPLGKMIKASDAKDDSYKNNFIKSNLHFDLDGLIKQKTESSETIKDRNVQLITIATPSSFAQAFIQYQSQVINISATTSSKNLETQIQDFFMEIYQGKKRNLQTKKENDPSILIIFFGPDEPASKIIFTQQKVAENIAPQRNTTEQIFVIIIMQVKDSFKMIPYIGRWELYYLEDLKPLQFIADKMLLEMLSLKNWFKDINLPIFQAINFEYFLKYFLSIPENTTTSYLRIRYKRVSQGYLQTRIQQIQKVFDFNSADNQIQQFSRKIIQLKMQFILKEMNIQNLEQFLEHYVIQQGFINQSQSLPNALLKSFQNLFSLTFAFFLSILEKNNLTYAYFYAANQQHDYYSLMITNTLEILNIKEFANLETINQMGTHEWNFADSLTLETESKDFSLPISEKIFKILAIFLKNPKQSTNDIKLESIVETLLNLIPSNDQKILRAFQEEAHHDFLKYFQLSMTQFDEEIVNQLIPSQGSDTSIFFLRYFVCNSFLKKEMHMLVSLLNMFYWIDDPCKICQGYQLESNQDRNVKKLAKYLLEKIFFMIQPSPNLMNKVKENKIKIVRMVEFLIRFINSIEIEREDGVLNIKQQLIIMQNIFLLFVGNIQIDLNILRSIDLQKINSLDIHYIKDLKAALKKINNKLSLEKSVLFGYQEIEDFENSDEYPNKEKIDQVFQSNWIAFILDLLLSVVQAKYDESFEQLCVQVINYLCFIETDHLASSQKFNDKMVIQINLILREVVKKCTSEQQLIEFFLIQGKSILKLGVTSESTTIVLLSSCIQQTIISTTLKNSRASSKLVKILLQTKNPENLNLLQKAIYLAIFREITYISVETTELLDRSEFDQDLRTIFSSNMPGLECLKIYIVKEFYHKYKEGKLMITKQMESYYFKFSYWLQKYAKPFTELVSSTFLTEEQLQSFERLFQQNYTLKQAIKLLCQEALPKSKNIFGQIYAGNFNENMFYPFMIPNNILLFHRDPQNNNQLYQCKNCKEYMFSDECPNLQSKATCARCQNLLFKGNDNIIQVLQKANEKPQKLKEIIQNNQWKGYYLRLVEDYDIFKLDQGCQLDLRLFTIAYNMAFFYAYEKGKKYTEKKIISFYKMKIIGKPKGAITTVFSEEKFNQVEITRLLKIHFEADPLVFLEEQIDYALLHISQIASKDLNMKEDDMRILIFKLLEYILFDQNIKGTLDAASRVLLNSSISSEIQQSVLQSKQNQLAQQNSTVRIIMESDVFDANSAHKEFKINLRTTRYQMSFDQLKDYLRNNLPNNTFLILKELLDQQEIEYASKSLKVLVKFSQLVNKHLSNIFTQKQAQEITLLNALQGDDSHPLYQFFLLELILAWEKIREQEMKFSAGCQTISIQPITTDTKLCNLILSSDKQYGFFSNVLELLCNKQNNILTRILDHAKSEKQDNNNPDILQFIEHLFEREEKTENKEIEVKTIEQLDTELNIIQPYDPSTLSKYIINDLNYSKGRNLICDLFGLQKEIARQAISNTVQISFKNSQMFPFLVEVTEINIFNINIPQQPLSDQQKQQLETAVQSREEGMDLLVKISTLFAIFRSEQNSANLSLEQALSSIQINIPSEKIRNLFARQLQLKHINGVIKILENKNMDQLIESCYPIYRQEIDKQQLQKTIVFLKNQKLLKNFSNALGRFIIRCLSQNQDSINYKSKLFEELFNSMTYEEFWDDPSVLDYLYQEAKKDGTSIGQSYVLFKEIRKVLESQKDSQLNSKKPNQKQSFQDSKPMMIESFNDKILNLGRTQNQYSLKLR